MSINVYFKFHSAHFANVAVLRHQSIIMNHTVEEVISLKTWMHRIPCAMLPASMSIVLWRLNFANSAFCAVYLPAGSTVVLLIPWGLSSAFSATFQPASSDSVDNWFEAINHLLNRSPGVIIEASWHPHHRWDPLVIVWCSSWDSPIFTDILIAFTSDFIHLTFSL